MKRFSIRIALEVPFHDVDSMQVVWHGHYLKYLEIARTQLLLAAGYKYHEMQNAAILWPVVDVHCRYVSPLRFGERFEVEATIMEIEHRLKIKYLIFGQDGKKRLKGSSTQLAVSRETGQIIETTELQQRLAQSDPPDEA